MVNRQAKIVGKKDKLHCKELGYPLDVDSFQAKNRGASLDFYLAIEKK